ncbi:MAG: class I SAM-dependent methyltransferase [Actinobacteria bacterium]|nr:class I SAM-dependent methyltransferase [Actinomycetota bacterium]
MKNVLRAVAPQSAMKFAAFCEQSVFDFLFGVSTRGSVHHHESTVTSGGDNSWYVGCQWLPIRRALRALDPGPSDVFVDLGSGKGKATLIAARLPFRRVIGVEINEDLTSCAKYNTDHARFRPRAQEVESVNDSVLSWPIPDDVSVVFMFNAFIGATFHAVVHRILESYDRRPRKLHIVYDNPWEHDWLLSTGRMVVEDVRSHSWPAPPRWWQGELVIVTYRVIGPAGTQSPPPTPGRLSRSGPAIRSWSGVTGRARIRPS